MEYPLQMASTLVDINQACTCKVRVLNPFPTAMSIKQDAVIGKAEPAEGIPVIFADEESKQEVNNFNRIRRVDFCREEKTCFPHNVSVRQACDTEVQEITKHLLTMYEQATANLSSQECKKVAQTLIKFQDTFSKDELDLGVTHLTEHSIKTGDAQPVKQPPRRVPLAFAGAEKKAIEDLKAKGVSPWASPIVLVSKKDGGVHPCVDYRKVNELVKPDGFPLPRIQDCLNSVAGAKLFSTLDLTSGYFQIPLKEEDIPKSAFVCKYGQFEMTRMPF